MYKNYPKTSTKEVEERWQGNDRITGEKDIFEHWLLHRTVDMDKNNLPREFLEISQKIFGDMYLQQK